MGVGSGIKSVNEPVYVKLSKTTDLKGVISISAGEENSAAVTDKVLIWGWNTCGQLGQGHFSNLSYPTSIEVSNITEISLGVSASGIISDGRLLSAGWVG